MLVWKGISHITLSKDALLSLLFNDGNKLGDGWGYTIKSMIYTCGCSSCEWFLKSTRKSL